MLLDSVNITEKFEYVLVFCIIEEHVPYDTVDAVNQAVSEVFSNNLVLTLYNSCTQAQQLISHRNITMGINYFGAVANHVADPDFQWNPECNKAVWLVGKPTKHDRLSLLYYFIDSGFASKYLTYSFNPEYCPFDLDPYAVGQTIIDSTWYPNKPGSVDYRKWAAAHTNEIGDVKLGKNQYNGVVYDTDIYKSHCCEIVTETFFHQPAFLTEKIHRSIALGFPFFMLGDHMEDYVRSLGYCVFTDIMQLPKLQTTGYGYLQASCKKLSRVVKLFCMRCRRPDIQLQVRNNIQHNKDLLQSSLDFTVSQVIKHIPEFAAILEFKCRLHRGENPVV